MSGKKILDAAALINASRGVLFKHVNLRQRQLENYNKTSTLAKAVKSQTDRVTLTLQAASALADRVNGPAINYTTGTRTVGNEASRGSLSQDHFYTPSPENQTKDKQSGKEVRISQAQAQASPLPDGTVPLHDGPHTIPEQDIESYPAPSHFEPAARPLLNEKGKRIGKLTPRESGRSSIPNPELSDSPPPPDRARILQRQAEKQIPSQSAEPPASQSSQPNTLQSEREADEPSTSQDPDAFYKPPKSTGAVLSALPWVKVPKNTEAVQEGDEHVPDEQINQDVFYPSKPHNVDDPQQSALRRSRAVPDQNDLSDEAYSELFHSRKVSHILRGCPNHQQNSKGLNLSGAEKVTNATQKSPQQGDYVSTSQRETANSSKSEEEEDTQSSAAELAKESSQTSGLEQGNSVCRSSFLLFWLYADTLTVFIRLPLAVPPRAKPLSRCDNLGYRHRVLAGCGNMGG